MSRHRPFTVAGARLVDGGDTVPGTHLRVVDGRIAALGGPETVHPGDVLVDGGGGTLLPGLIDAHVHLLPGCTRLAAIFGVTTVVDQFSKAEVIDVERTAVADAHAGRGPARADLRTSGVGATAPGGHPTMAYAPIPYVTGPGDAAAFVGARLAEGATHLKVILDDGSGVMLDIPSLDDATISALVDAAHRARLPVVAHVSTAAGAVRVARCGVDVLAHAPFDDMSAAQVRDVARTGVALIATLGLVDGFPGPDGVLPLSGEPGLAERLSPRWRRVLLDQSRRWMPQSVPDGAPARRNTLALHAAGVRVLAGTDAPNPGLVFGASLHRELAHLVRAGLRPGEALAAATAVPATVFGLGDRGWLAVGLRADLLLVDGDPTADVTATAHLRSTWVAGREVTPGTYPGSADERDTLAALRRSTEKIVTAIRDRWPGIPTPTDVHRDDGELLGRIVPTAGGWRPTTAFGAPLGAVADERSALETVRRLGPSVLTTPWWASTDGTVWQQVTLLEVRPDRVRLRWDDPETEQPPAGRWVGVDDLDLTAVPPVSAGECTPGGLVDGGAG